MNHLSHGFLVVFLGCGWACGRTGGMRHDDAAVLEDAGAVGAGDSPAAASDALAQLDANVEARPAYAGVVLGLVTEDESTTRYLARAVFTEGSRPAIGGCPRCCCADTRRGLPIPRKPSDAGKITIATVSAPTTLVPAAFQGGSGTYYAMLDLGWSWNAPLGDYAPVDSEPWQPGDELRIQAIGNEVAAFSGVLRTGPALAGIRPPIGSSIVEIDHIQSFEVSWEPAGMGEATVLLEFPYTGGICFCDAPDSVGRILVAPNLLSPMPVEANGRISLSRLTTSTVSSANATIDLVGAVARAGRFAIR